MPSYLEIAKVSGQFGAAVVAGTGSTSDNQYATLTGLGYTGSITDMERKDFLAKLSLTEPPSVNKSHADLEMAYLGSLGKTGSLADRQHN